MPKGFHWLVAAQFVSGLADHALLIIAIAHLHEQGYPTWWAPLLKFAFTWAYVLLGPVAGAWADAVPKHALMGWMNGLKAAGALALLLGLHPLASFAWMGIGAALYAPAKYGLLTESVPGRHLVTANGWLEVSVVLSVLLGTGLGGWLISARLIETTADLPRFLGNVAPPTQLGAGFLSVLLLYALAGAFNLRIPAKPARHPMSGDQAFQSWKTFREDNARLWRDPLGGLSLAVTTLFWGFGAVMQFAVLSWATEQLDLPLSQAAYLQAVVALGVVLGAASVAHRVALRSAPVVLPLGVLLGGALAGAVHVTHLGMAVTALLIIGALAGALVVPMNALLQYRGHRLLSPGRSIAIQGFNENASVIVWLATFSTLLRFDFPLLPLLTGLGALMATGLGVLWWVSRRWRLRWATRVRSVQ